MVTYYNWLFILWWAKVPKEIIFFKNVFVNSSHGSYILISTIISWKLHLK